MVIFYKIAENPVYDNMSLSAKVAVSKKIKQIYDALSKVF